MTQPKSEFRRGVEAAAGLAAEYATTHPYRLDDVILCKLNQTKRLKPRRNKRRVPDPKDAWLAGFAVALAEMHRLRGDSWSVRDVAQNAGLTIALAKKCGVDPYDLRELRKAGVAR